MTIETETVPNIGTHPALKADHYTRSLKARASTDTVRAQPKPKKKKSRVVIANANHIPTKSEIYAATITQAVDENDESDSDETFVYESNPRSPKRLSRSPSIISMHSTLGDRHVSTSRLESGPKYSRALHIYDDRDREKLQRTHAISGKRSMKFANRPGDEDTQRRHVSHTIGVGARRSYAEESPFNTKSPRMRPGLERRVTSPGSSGPNSPRLSRPASPRQLYGYGATNVRKERKGGPTNFRPWSLYEDEEEAVSPSERSPFLRKRSSRLQQRYRREQPSGLWTGTPFVMVIVCLMLVLCMIAAAALSTSQPLRDVRVVNVTNVLVSKQELLFDLVVEAYNPNALAVTVKNLEISVFAQSPYVRDEDNPKSPHDEAQYWLARSECLASHRHARSEKQSSDAVAREKSFGNFWPPWKPGCNGSDSDFPEDEDSTTLLLGRVYEFDSSLQFESRFFNRSVSTASGELRVVKPGNITDEDGVETWERVIQHSFELIVRGVMKYQSSGFAKTWRTAEVYKTAHINPAKFEQAVQSVS